MGCWLQATPSALVLLHAVMRSRHHHAGCLAAATALSCDLTSCFVANTAHDRLWLAAVVSLWCVLCSGVLSCHPAASLGASAPAAVRHGQTAAHQAQQSMQQRLHLLARFRYQRVVGTLLSRQGKHVLQQWKIGCLLRPLLQLLRWRCDTAAQMTACNTRASPTAPPRPLQC